jgi:hypothetical protein
VDKTGYIEIRITGFLGNLKLTPDTYDIKEIIAILENTEHLLFHGEKKDRPIISYKIEEGSVRHLFKTSIQYIIGFNAIIGQILQQQNIDFLDLSTANAFEKFQENAVKKDHIFNISTSLDGTNEIRIDKTTRFYRAETVWVDAEFYFYGKVVDAGGKEKANIHISTEEMGTIKVATPIPFLEQYENNLLYKPFGIRARGKQHSETGEIDKNSLRFVELVDYQPKYDELYLKSLRDKAKKNWLGNIDSEKWLLQIRGGYDA